MNWTGGSRSRVNIKNTKNNLEDCSAVQQSRPMAERYETSNPNLQGNSNLSQDIIFLNMLMSQPATPLGRKVTRLHLRTPKRKHGWQTCNIDLPASPPGKLSKLQMLFPALAPSSSSASTQEKPPKEAREVKENPKQGSESVETQTDMKLLIDVGVQTEDQQSDALPTEEDN